MTTIGKTTYPNLLAPLPGVTPVARIPRLLKEVIDHSGLAIS